MLGDFTQFRTVRKLHGEAVMLREAHPFRRKHFDLEVLAPTHHKIVVAPIIPRPFGHSLHDLRAHVQLTNQTQVLQLPLARSGLEKPLAEPILCFLQHSYIIQAQPAQPAVGSQRSTHFLKSLPPDGVGSSAYNQAF